MLVEHLHVPGMDLHAWIRGTLTTADQAGLPVLQNEEIRTCPRSHNWLSGTELGLNPHLSYSKDHTFGLCCLPSTLIH